MGPNQNAQPGPNELAIPIGHAVNSSEALSKRLKATGTRGIRHKDGTGTYDVLPAKSDSIQGRPITLACVDELHILRADIWQAIINGQRAQKRALVVGITTAGDDTSVLLLDLYKQAYRAIPDPDTRFGAFIWESDTGAAVDDPEAIKQANPAVECGRISIEDVLSDTKDLPEFDRRRFLLNQFISNTNSWMEYSDWIACAGKGLTTYDDLWYGVDVNPIFSYASIIAGRKNAEGQIEIELVASLVNPTIEGLRKLCDQLTHKGKFIMDTYRLADLADYLVSRGKTVTRVNSRQMNVRAATMAYQLIKQHKVKHASDPVIDRQMPLGVAKTSSSGDGWRIVAPKKGVALDALYATVLVLYAAEIEKKRSNTITVLRPAA